MNVFYKVHIREFDNFIDYILKVYDDKLFYQGDYKIRELRDNYTYKKSSNIMNNYLYICVDDIRGGSDCEYYYLTYMNFNKNNYDVLINVKWIYKGEFNGRKDKLKKLNLLNDKL